MDGLDFILCAICALLIWLLWQQLERVKLEEERRKLTCSEDEKEVKIKKKPKSDIRERIIIEERETNFKKPTPSFPPQSVVSLPSKPPLLASPLAPPPPQQHPSTPSPSLSPTPQSSPVLSVKTALPRTPIDSSDQINLIPAAVAASLPVPVAASTSSPASISLAGTAIPATSTTESPIQTQQCVQNFDGSNENRPEWEPIDKQAKPLQKPWVFEGEAHYPPNFFTTAHQSKQ